jgi:outer membrane murein-binding lipoprotein Lpp
MHAQQSPFYPRGRETGSFLKTTLLPSVPSSPEANAMKSPVFSDCPSFVTLDQLGHYEDCIAMVSKQVAICRDECVALQESLRLSDAKLREKNSTIECLMAQQQQLKQNMQQTTEIVKAMKIKDFQNQQQLFLKTNQQVSCTDDEKKETYKTYLLCKKSVDELLNRSADFFDFIGPIY